MQWPNTVSSSKVMEFLVSSIIISSCSIFVCLTLLSYIVGLFFCDSRKEKAFDLAERIVEAQYELTDRITHYLCGRKPGVY